MVERAARLLGGRRAALDRQLVAARADVDAELLLEPGEVFVELSVERACQPVVVEGENDVRHVRSPGGRVLQFSRGGQTSLLNGRHPLAMDASSAMQAVATGLRDSHLHNVTDFAGLFINYHRQQPGRAADLLAGLAARLLDQHIDLAANQRNGEFALLFRKQRLQALQALVLLGFRNLAVHVGAGRAGAPRIFEREGLRVAHRPHELQRRLEIGLGLAGKADDEIARHGDIGPGSADALDQPEIVGGRVAAVHRLQDAVGAGLHRQMQIGHQRRQVAMRGDQRVVHVARMAGGVAQPRQAGDFGEPGTASWPSPHSRAVRPLAVPGVDVLAEQRDLADAGGSKPLGLGDDLRDRPRNFRAARIGHHAEGAELVAALLDGEEGGDAAAPDRGSGRAPADARTCPRSRSRSRRPSRRRGRGARHRAAGGRIAGR